jgi:hypothetical protein
MYLRQTLPVVSMYLLSAGSLAPDSEGTVGPEDGNRVPWIHVCEQRGPLPESLESALRQLSYS